MAHYSMFFYQQDFPAEDLYKKKRKNYNKYTLLFKIRKKEEAGKKEMNILVINCEAVR